MLKLLSFLPLFVGVVLGLYKENFFIFIVGTASWILMLSLSVIVRGFEVYIENNERKGDNNSNNE